MKEENTGSHEENMHPVVTTQPAAQVKHHNTGEYRNTPFPTFQKQHSVNTNTYLEPPTVNANTNLELPIKTKIALNC